MGALVSFFTNIPSIVSGIISLVDGANRSVEEIQADIETAQNETLKSKSNYTGLKSSIEELEELKDA